ncbi:MAG: hypothetical protein ABSG36_09935 [Acidimicrobiales bacterium]|jgi:hypothetical protein
MTKLGQMDQRSFKAMARGLVIGLVIVIALAADDITIPKNRSSGKNWNFALTHSTILLHIIFGTIVVLTAIVLLIRSIRSGDRSSIVVSLIGLAFVLLAWAMGEQYVATLKNSALSDMGIGWFGAIAAYGTGWYLKRTRSTTVRSHVLSKE